jgi:hypothetical protein
VWKSTTPHLKFKVTLRLIVGQSWCPAPSGAHDHILVTILSTRDALSDQRTGLSFVRIAVTSNKSVVRMYIIFTFYMLLNLCIYNIYKASCQPRNSKADHALSLVAHTTIAVKPLERSYA